MKMNSLFPENARGVSRWDLLQVWSALNWLERNNKNAFKDAAKSVGLSEKELAESVRYLGYEVKLWNPNAKFTHALLEDDENDEDLTH